MAEDTPAETTEQAEPVGKYRCPGCGIYADEPGDCTGKAESSHQPIAFERFSPLGGLSGSSEAPGEAETGAESVHDQAPPAA